jgi:hypothetical protein
VDPLWPRGTEPKDGKMKEFATKENRLLAGLVLTARKEPASRLIRTDQAARERSICFTRT